jgi:hypothetical protein
MDSNPETPARFEPRIFRKRSLCGKHLTVTFGYVKIRGQVLSPTQQKVGYSFVPWKQRHNGEHSEPLHAAPKLCYPYHEQSIYIYLLLTERGFQKSPYKFYVVVKSHVLLFSAFSTMGTESLYRDMALTTQPPI